MATLDSGKIWEDRTTKEILLGITKNRKAELIVLHISSQGQSIEGDILISKSSTVNGAHMLDPETVGYKALKVLLGVEHGSFVISDASENPASADLEQNLKLRLNHIINALPDLPERVELLTDGTATARLRSQTAEADLPDLEEATGTKTVESQTAGEAEKKSLPAVLIIIAAVAFFATLATIAVLTFKPPTH